MLSASKKRFAELKSLQYCNIDRSVNKYGPITSSRSAFDHNTAFNNNLDTTPSVSTVSELLHVQRLGSTPPQESMQYADTPVAP
jgi:hypothetical protein